MIYSFENNPFRVLGASPADERRSLIERADEAALLGEDDASGALDVLLSTQSRLDAEICWFPDTDPACVEEILHYPDEAQPRPYPEIRTRSALAVFNACRVLLTTWKVWSMDGYLAIFKSLAASDAVITAQDVMEQINADRARAGIQLVTSLSDTAYALEELRRETARQLMERLEKAMDIRPAMCAVAQACQKVYSPLLEQMVGIYELNTAEKALKLSAEMRNLASITPGLPMRPIREDNAKRVESLLGRWGDLTEPMRRLEMSKGIAGDASLEICRAVRDLAVNLQNQHFMMKECYALLGQLKKVFWNLPDAVAQVDRDIATLDEVRKKILSTPFQKASK